MVSTTGYVYVEGRPERQVSVRWPAEPAAAHARVRAGLRHRVRLELLVTVFGELRLVTGGTLVVASPMGAVPLPLARVAGALFPMTELGRNVMSATLLRASGEPCRPRSDRMSSF